MPKYKVDASELVAKDAALVSELESFLRERFEAVERLGNEVSVELESKRRLRQVLKKFLHKAELKGEFRVISSREDSFKVGGRRASHR